MANTIYAIGFTSAQQPGTACYFVEFNSLGNVDATGLMPVQVGATFNPDDARVFDRIQEAEELCTILEASTGIGDVHLVEKELPEGVTAAQYQRQRMMAWAALGHALTPKG